MRIASILFMLEPYILISLEDEDTFLVQSMQIIRRIAVPKMSTFWTFIMMVVDAFDDLGDFEAVIIDFIFFVVVKQLGMIPSFTN